MDYHFEWGVVWRFRGVLWAGLLVTLQLSVLGTLGAVALGIPVGAATAGRLGFLRSLARSYVEFLRNVPVVVKLFFFYFAFGFGEIWASVFGLALHQSAYIADVVRSGVQSIPPTQVEAALSSGLSRLQTARHVVVPQALRLVIPPLTSQVIEVVKNSSVAMMISVTELTFATQEIEHATFRGFEAATAVTGLYLVLGLAIAWGMGRLEVAVRLRR